MSWSIHSVSLAAPDLERSRHFFGTCLGLGPSRAIDDRTHCFGYGSRGLRLRRPRRVLGRSSDAILAEASARHFAIETNDLAAIAGRLDRASIAYQEAPAGHFETRAIFTLDPALNVVAFCEPEPQSPAGTAIQPSETGSGWGIHHVNLPAADVREAVAFYVEIAGMPEGRWRAPASRGDFSIDTRELAVLTLDDTNRGLHVIRPDAGFALRNAFAHNPSIGGHPAFHVPDVKAVKVRLEAAGVMVSDAGVYAMAGMHQIYTLDPAANMIEVNQFV